MGEVVRVREFLELGVRLGEDVEELLDGWHRLGDAGGRFGVEGTGVELLTDLVMVLGGRLEAETRTVGATEVRARAELGG